MKNKKDYSIESNVNGHFTNSNQTNIAKDSANESSMSGDFSNKAFKSFIKENVHRPKVPVTFIQTIKDKIK